MQDLVWVEQITNVETSSDKRVLMRMSKSGGDAVELTQSRDVRSFLGVTIYQDHVYYSTFTSLMRVPLAGGDVKFVGESPGAVQYWIYSPRVIDGVIYWTSFGGVYQLTLGGSKVGKEVATLPGSGAISSGDDPFVFRISQSIFETSIDAALELDRSTMQVGPMRVFGSQIQDVVLAGENLWAATYDGFMRTGRMTGEPEIIAEGVAFGLVRVGNAIFVATDSGVGRQSLSD